MTSGNVHTRKREAKFRRSMERTQHVAANGVNLATRGRINVHSYYDRAELAHSCAVKAVQICFGHLAAAQIITPPRSMKDAQFARQIAIHIMVHGLGIEQRHVTRMQHRQRTSIHFALQAVERRLECAAFDAAYERMTLQAQRHFKETVEAA